MSAPISNIEFRIVYVPDPSGALTLPTVEPVIDGQLLNDLATDFQTVHYGASRLGYSGLYLYDVSPPSTHYYGTATCGLHSAGDRVSVLECGSCGEPLCWPLLCHIDVQPEVVVWHDFSQPHRGPESKAGHWPYEGFGPFHFDRKQYDQALAMLARPDQSVHRDP